MIYTKIKFGSYIILVIKQHKKIAFDFAILLSVDNKQIGSTKNFFSQSKLWIQKTSCDKKNRGHIFHEQMSLGQILPDEDFPIKLS